MSLYLPFDYACQCLDSGVSSGLKLMAAFFFIADWFLICRSDNKDLEKALPVIKHSVLVLQLFYSF